MEVIRVRNVQEALPRGVEALFHSGISAPSRNGEVLAMPCPVTTVYSRPTERVIFWPERDANPFFHFFESLWMLAGRNDVTYVEQFAKRMRDYSDDGEVIYGAYGFRWRTWFGFDQIEAVVEELKRDPFSRRAVLTMWSPNGDLIQADGGVGGLSSKDIPCNTQIYLRRASGELHMTLTCRSNDIVWGAYGANAVHFSMLQEYLAGMLGTRVGTLYQVSNNFHGYKKTLGPVQALLHKKMACPYAAGIVQPYPIMDHAPTWDRDLGIFLRAQEEGTLLNTATVDPGPEDHYTNSFFTQVATPLAMAHLCYTDKSDPCRFDKARNWLLVCAATDWKLAAADWLDRREGEYNARQAS